MPKRTVQFYPGEFYHVYNRGNGKQDIFYDDKDRYRFLQAVYLSNSSSSFVGIPELERNKRGYTLLEIKNVLEENKISHDPLVRIIADCLMPNHFHFFIEEIQKNGVARFMQRLGTSYAKYFTIKHNRPGSLFQGRFKAVHVKDNSQFTYLLAYINIINPAQIIEPNLKKDGIENIDKVWEWVNSYKWGSHQEYINKRESIIVDKGLMSKIFPDVESYQEFCKDVLRGKEKNIWQELGNTAID